MLALMRRLLGWLAPADLFDVWLEEPEGWDEREHL